MELGDFPFPDTRAGDLAREVVTQYSAPALVNHCLRSYLFAASLAAIDGFDVDHELLYVSSLLHDLGLEPAFDNVIAPFEEAGGHVGWVFAAGAGWPASRRDRVAQIIVAHMRDPEVGDDPEGYLLAAATSLDISGIDPQRWPDALLHEVVARHPRLDLGPRFTACFRDQAVRKPGSAAAASVRRGIAARITTNV
ncbi:MAG TPA: HD domain-containing protein, partial [Jatrophihabitans sp.]|nr:HD domain-containing protein [Jatrophihabitans sp.]